LVTNVPFKPLEFKEKNQHGENLEKRNNRYLLSLGLVRNSENQNNNYFLMQLIFMDFSSSHVYYILYI
jgi:hypothetical protein